MGGGRVALSKLLVANRGEIACRIIKTAQRLGIPTVAVFSDADRSSLAVHQADEAFHIGGAAASDSYLRRDRILEVAAATAADAVHPGYGFLSENAAFARECEAAGVRFVGPPADAMHAMGDKTMAKAMMSAAGVPVVPGYHGEEQQLDRLVAEARAVGFPLLVKAAMGGGGKGMKLARSEAEVEAAILSAKREAASSFGDDRVLLERFIERPRHVEVQVFADTHGNVVHLYERDCSVQRRHQKVIEEAPAPGLAPSLRAQFGEAAVAAARAVGYVNAGTVEFIMDTDTDDFYFMEMNTRLQVEHPVTEAVTGVDLVEWQLRVAAGQRLPLSQDRISCTGHAFEGRLYAERPDAGFMPATGTLARWRLPRGARCFEWGGQPGDAGVRVDSGVQEGDEVGVHYDPMIAKVLARGPDRPTALAALHRCLVQLRVAGLPTNQELMQRIAEHPAFMAGGVNTSFLDQHADTLLGATPPPPLPAALAWLAVHGYDLARHKAAHAAAPVLGPWGLQDNFRVNHALAAAARLTHPASGATYRLDVTYERGGALQLRVRQYGGGDAEADAAPDADERLTVDRRELKGDGGGAGAGASLSAVVNGRIFTADALCQERGGAGGGDRPELEVDVWYGGGGPPRRYQFVRPGPPDWRAVACAGAGGGEARLLSPLPGKVIQVAVREGEAVEEGQVVVVVAAMKMEHAVRAPRAGVLVGLLVEAGDQVQQGDLLAAVTDSAEAAAAA